MSIREQLNRINKKLDLRLDSIANKVMQETKEMLRESINDLWYSTYSPKDYVRSYELLNSVNGKVIKNSIGNYTIEVYFDENLMNSNPSLYGWGTHVGFDDGDFRKGLIESVIHRMKGSDNNPRKGQATNVIEVVQQQAEKYANSILKKYL